MACSVKPLNNELASPGLLLLVKIQLDSYSSRSPPFLLTGKPMTLYKCISVTRLLYAMYWCSTGVQFRSSGIVIWAVWSSLTNSFSERQFTSQLSWALELNSAAELCLVLFCFVYLHECGSTHTTTLGWRSEDIWESAPPFTMLSPGGGWTQAVRLVTDAFMHWTVSPALI